MKLPATERATVGEVENVADTEVTQRKRCKGSDERWCEPVRWRWYTN